ncbi:DUF456 domain-containing protein [Salsuginibacillus kocurii]|uniref:DUF456 domain-containing protein n=1 Tax=Salsuginibacillus kocurii TaxID=427078 RepID=UPI000476A4AD|nr:DUF456 domain-containing protein [Salsuginibacillus kocurii]
MLLLILALICYGLAWVGLIYPLFPSVLFYVGALIFGVTYLGWGEVGIGFWLIQFVILLLLLIVDYLTSMLGIERSGGSKWAVWGSLLGLIIGPFVLPVFGIVIGVVIGAILGEIIGGARTFRHLLSIGSASLLGFLAGVVVKGMALLGGLIYFFIVL